MAIQKHFHRKTVFQISFCGFWKDVMILEPSLTVEFNTLYFKSDRASFRFSTSIHSEYDNQLVGDEAFSFVPICAQRPY